MPVLSNKRAHEYLDNARFLSDREKREAERIVAADDQKWSAMAADQYGSTVQRLSRDVDAVTRICATGEETVDQILEDLANGEIDAGEAARALGAARRDLNKMRKVATEAEQFEARAWDAVDCTPADFSEALERRAPVLFQGGKNHVALPD